MANLTLNELATLDCAYAAYLSAINSTDELAKARAIIRLDNVEKDFGARSNANRGAVARKLLGKAGSY